MYIIIIAVIRIRVTASYFPLERFGLVQVEKEKTCPGWARLGGVDGGAWQACCGVTTHHSPGKYQEILVAS